MSVTGAIEDYAAPWLEMPSLALRRLSGLTHLPAEHALSRLAYTLKRPLFASPVYRLLLAGRAPTALEAALSDPWPGNAETGTQRILWDSFDLQGLTYVRYRPATVGAFEWYQPSGSGELALLDTNFYSTHEVLRVRPARPVLTSTPASPIPVGGYLLDLEGGVPGGVVLMFVAGDVAAGEVPLANRQWPAPLFLGLDLTAGLFLAQVFALDAGGEIRWSAKNPGLAGLTLGVQGFVGETASGPFYGTSQPLQLVYQ